MRHLCNILERRYTGYIPGVQETFKKGPIPSQVEVLQPDADSFIKTRTEVAPKSNPARDACNNPANFLKAQPGNLWPAQQSTAAQEPFRPPPASVAFGDLRVDVFRTSYNQDFKVRFIEAPGQACLILSFHYRYLVH